MERDNPSLEYSWRYCQEALPKVSRTFALNIQVLRGDLHRSMLLVYLICRTLDTVEDSPSLPAELKVHFLRQFPAIFTREDWETPLQEWIDGLTKGGLDGAPADVDLLRHAKDVTKCFKKLPWEYQLPGEKLFGIMGNGMADIIERLPRRSHRSGGRGGFGALLLLCRRLGGRIFASGFLSNLQNP